MMVEQGTILDPVWAAYIGVVATIMIGIWFTKDDKRNKENIVSNIVSFALLLATVTFTLFMLSVMMAYLLIGIGVTLKQMKDLFFLFGSKTYGSVALVVLLASENRLGLFLPEKAFEMMTVYIITLAIILSSVAHLLSWLHFRKKSRSPTSLKALFGGMKKKGTGGRKRARKGRRTVER